VYATAPIPAGTLVDISPVLLLTEAEYYGRREDGTVCGPGELRGVEGSQLRGYVFTWKGREGGMALALGMGELEGVTGFEQTEVEVERAGGLSRTEAGADKWCNPSQARFSTTLSSPT